MVDVTALALPMSAARGSGQEPNIDVIGQGPSPSEQECSRRTGVAFFARALASAVPSGPPVNRTGRVEAAMTRSPHECTADFRHDESLG